jgi:hypothetical protein
MDDSSVSQVSIQTVMKQQAYLLFYIQSNPPHSSSSPSSPATPVTAPAAAAAPATKSSELDLSSTLQKRKFSENSSPPLTEKERQQLPVGNGSLRSNLDDGDDDDDDPLGDLLFLAKKHQIELPQSVSQSHDNSSSSLPSDLNPSTESSRLPPKRFGIFR